MKKILIATTALIATAGVAAAEVAVSGNARMGLSNNNSVNKFQFTSRVRVVFTMSGETDGGLQFGASVRNDQGGQGGGSSTTTTVPGGANNDSTVYISGAFGKISFGDNDSAANATVGHVAGVGLTGLGDANELGYLGQTDTSVLYTYSTGPISVALSVGQLNGTATATANQDAVSIAAKYTMGDYYAALGYETAKVGVAAVKDNQLSFAVGGNVGPVAAKLVIADRKSWGKTQYALSGTYTMDALSVTAFYANKNTSLVKSNAYGIGGSYDLGGGAKVVGGLSKTKGAKTVADFGVSMNF